MSQQQARDTNVGKRHHYVPQMYLRRWAGPDGRVRLTKMATGAVHDQSPDEVANQPNLYTIAAPDLETDYPTRWLEKHMSRIESDAAGWLQALDGLPAGRIDNWHLTDDLAVYVALQDQRTLRKRSQDLRIEDALNRFGRAEVLSPLLPFVCRLYQIPYTPRRHGALLQQFLAQPLISEDRKARAIESAVGVWRNQAVPHFAKDRRWWLIDSASPLITCDEPVVYLGGTARPRWKQGSWITSPIMLFPVGPHRLIAMTFARENLSAPYELNASESEAVNFEIAAASDAFCFEQPTTTIASSLNLPPWPEPDPASAATFIEAVMAPSRWKAGEGPPWAIARWY
ncbi:DUF4238 domain-containing protein [Candidatus Mycobacterium wuenschmannii]|uniref:DUF4238 domain-containing protein n=1 Tax=Candidatus Mycobacterium wuenschmannii TaxID=3027808 RepID=A0ABY8W072_9MYCO|nr:DUF4238 domain-containing protein [Candidatus Mycobacterium wuenschmannii]WIM88362.1 DUF4238 domain-containing protein [Candidatus Mycobacterium wuenschmannii]